MELTGSAEKQMNFLKWSTDELFALQQQAELNTHLNMLKRGVDGQSFQNFDPTSRYRFHRPDTILPRNIFIMWFQIHLCRVGGKISSDIPCKYGMPDLQPLKPLSYQHCGRNSQIK